MSTRYLFYKKASIFILLFVIAGCACNTGEYKRVKYNYQVGSTHVAVLSVTPWEEVVADLQPEFQMTTKIALDESTPTTLRYEEQLKDSLITSLSASAGSSQSNIPLGTGSSGSKQQTGKAESVGATGGQQAKASTDKKQNAETAQPIGNNASAGTTGGQQTSTPTDKKQTANTTSDKTQAESVGRDPMTKYLTATALFQEVKMLNRYLHDAATRKDYRTYVVRLQISVMPNARNMPYDAYLNISFFTTTYGKILEDPKPPYFTDDDFTKECSNKIKKALSKEDLNSVNDMLETSDLYDNKDINKWKSPRVRQLRQIYNASIATSNKINEWCEQTSAQCNNAEECQGRNASCGDLKEYYASKIAYNRVTLNRAILEETYTDCPVKPHWDNVIIIPLLVTDDIEAMASSKNLQNFRQLELSILAAASVVKGTAGFTKTLDDLQKIYGENFNSLLSVARVSDNTLRVRLGAMQQASSRYVTVPSTHNISVLLLVPEKHIEENKNPKIYIDSQTNFVDSSTGEVLINSQEYGEVNSEIKALLKNNNFSPTDNNVKLVQDMTWDFFTNKYYSFLQHFEQLQLNGNDMPDLSGDDATSLYMDIGQLAVGSVNTYASFALPERQVAKDHIPTQTILVIDDGAESKAVLKTDCSNPTISIRSASLIISHDGKKYDEYLIDDVKFSNKWCEQLILTFPSLALMGYTEPDGKLNKNMRVSIKLQLNDNSCGDCRNIFEIHYVYHKKETDSNSQIKGNYNVKNNAPTNLKVTVVPPNHIELAWANSSTDKTDIKIERKTSKDSTYVQIATVGAKATNYSDNAVNADETYFYRVCSYNSSGDSACSDTPSIRVSATAANKTIK